MGSAESRAQTKLMNVSLQMTLAQKQLARTGNLFTLC